MAKVDPEAAIRSVDKLLAEKRQITAIFDQMVISQSGEYREILRLSEESQDYKINRFMFKWGYMREQAFLTFLEQYGDELIQITERRAYAD